MMLVRERMTRHPITIDPETSVTDALEFMRQNRVRRLPVLDKKGRLIGIVSEKDLLYASPSPATSLDVWEIGYLLSKLKVKGIMTREVVTIEDSCTVDDAARSMVDHRIGGLPVTHKGELVGIITETDLFKVFMEMLGTREQGLRVSLSMLHEPGMLATLAGEVASMGGDIIALSTFHGQDRAHSWIAMKVSGIQKDSLLQAIEKTGAEVLAVRDDCPARRNTQDSVLRSLPGNKTKQGTSRLRA
jgi:acetoin utilization protein AcuB